MSFEGFNPKGAAGVALRENDVMARLVADVRNLRDGHDNDDHGGHLGLRRHRRFRWW
ncbi:MAG: hypothetical protein V9G13_12015 [Marmoricola sp.]